MFKKISITTLALLCVVAIASGKKNTVETVGLANLNDSINYALGLVNGSQIKSYQFRNDSSLEAIYEFSEAIVRGYEDRVEELSEAASIGMNIGIAIKQSSKTGLADNPAWTLNQALFFQGMVNGLYGDSIVWQKDSASNYFQTKYRESALSNDSTIAGKTIKGTCPNKVKKVKLASENDSLNYAFGYLNGVEIAQYILISDSTGAMKKEFVVYVNKGLKSTVRNPKNITMGEEIGTSIRQQELIGLLGEESLAVNFQLIHRGIMDALKGGKTLMEVEEAGNYLQATLMEVRYGESRRDNEHFLVENTQKEGVITTASGLQYEVITMGNGIRPSATDQVNVHYEGTLIDGTVFDSSYERGESITFGLNQVIAGWTEGLQLMPAGSKFRLYISQELGYGERETGSIPPYSTLIFDVELLNVVYENTEEDNDKFLSANAARACVKTTASGLQYEIITQGQGKTPRATDKVKLNYQGTLIDGTVFDSGKASVFSLDQVIKGWSEGLQLMSVGSKYRFYIPQELGYGDQKHGDIPALSTLVFEIELLNIEIENTPETNVLFLVENAQNEAIKTTDSGLQYEIITLGEGITPSATDTVTVHYHGTLIDNTVFDSSVERGEPITFALDQVIAGWSEALQLMPVGSKFRIFVPEQLAYGKMRIGAIAPHSTLIFELELLDCHPNLNPIVEVVEEVVEEVVADEEAIAVEVVEEEVNAEEAVVEEI